MKLIPKVKDIFPEVKCIHCLTHSSTSQYRNRTIFQLVARYEENFGVKARWDYLEAGHGKGLCDGLGASVNRSASNAVTQGRAVIQSAEDFFVWSQQISGSAVQYIYLSKDGCRMARELLQARSAGLKQVVGTMQVHAVSAVDRTAVLTRDVSCYCQSCIRQPSSSHAWKRQVLQAAADSDVPSNEQDDGGCQVYLFK